MPKQQFAIWIVIPSREHASPIHYYDNEQDANDDCEWLKAEAAVRSSIEVYYRVVPHTVHYSSQFKDTAHAQAL